MTLDTLRTMAVPGAAGHDDGQRSGEGSGEGCGARSQRAEGSGVLGSGVLGSGTAGDPRAAEHPALFGGAEPTHAGTTTGPVDRTPPGLATSTATGTATGCTADPG